MTDISPESLLRKVVQGLRNETAFIGLDDNVSVRTIFAILDELDQLRAEVKIAHAQAFRDAADWHQTEVVRNNITALHWTAKKTSDGQAEQYALEYSGKCDAHRESEDHFRQLAAEAEKPKEG